MFEWPTCRGPHPVSSKLLAMALILATSMSCSEPAAVGPSPASSPVATPVALKPTSDGDPFAVSTDDIAQSVAPNFDDIKPPAENPFQLVRAGLPPHASPYLSGTEFYLSADRVRQIVANVFERAGYRLTARHPYQRGAVTLVTDGFDVDRKIGFIVCHYDNLEGDWWNPQLADGDAESAINELLQRITARGNFTIPPLLAEIHTAKSLPDPARREAAYRAILVRTGREKISRVEMQQLAQPIKNGQDFIAVVNPYDLRLAIDRSVDYTSELDKQLDSSTHAEFIGETRVITDGEIDEKRERKAVAALQQAVREYIVWARSQRAQ